MTSINTPHAKKSIPTPQIDVSHLPSAATFYLSITQPLGIKYLSSFPDPSTGLSTKSVNFGFGEPLSKILFTLTQTPEITTRSRISLPAQTEETVTEFYEYALRATGAEGGPTQPAHNHEGDLVSSVTDFDGNMVTAHYASHHSQGQNSSRRSSAGGPGTAPPESKHAKKVLDWQKEVALSVSSAVGTSKTQNIDRGREERIPLPRRETFPMAYRPRERSIGSRAASVRTVEIERQPPPATAGESRGIIPGMSNSALFGTILGAAAGAAVAYAMVRGDESSKPTITNVPPSRAAARSIVYRDMGAGVTQVGRQSYGTTSNVGNRQITLRDKEVEERERERIIEIERRVASIMNEVRGSERGQRYLTYNVPTPSQLSRAVELVEIRDDADTGRSEASRSSKNDGGGGSGRSRADSGISLGKSKASEKERGRPSAIIEAEIPASTTGRSHHSHKSHRSHRSHRPKDDQYADDARDLPRDINRGDDDTKSKISYVSARTSGSGSTVKEERRTHKKSKSKVGTSNVSHRSSHRHHRKHRSSGSDVTATPENRDRDRDMHRDDRDIERDGDRQGERGRSHISARHYPLPPSTAGSARYVPLPPSTAGSARYVPLPESVVRGYGDDGGYGYDGYGYGGARGGGGGEYGRDRGGYAGYGDGDEDSVAPSDSVSCAGGKREWEARRREERERLRSRF